LSGGAEVTAMETRRFVLDSWLVGLCSTRFLLTIIFLTYAACLPVLRTAWGMSATQAGSISTGFQVGYAISLFGFSWLADRIGARRIFMISAALSAASAIAFAALARSYLSGLLLFTLVALAQGGVYTTAIMLIADRYPAAQRGMATGVLIAGSSMSHAASLLLAGTALARGGYQLAFATAAAGPVVGAFVTWLVLRDTPNVVHPRHAEMRIQTELLRNPEAMKLTAGYTAHSWELLGMWAWTPAFVAASLALSGVAATRATQIGAYITASFHVIGIVAPLAMGRLSDQLGRRAVLIGTGAASATCSLLFGWLVAAPLWLLFAIGAAFSFAALGDSPVLSVATTEAVHPAYLGAAFAVRSLFGFGAGAIAPLVFGAILDATNGPSVVPPRIWGWSFVALGIGGLVAAACAWSLKRRPVGAFAVAAAAGAER
jgi:MFS family permease